MGVNHGSEIKKNHNSFVTGLNEKHFHEDEMGENH